MQCPHCSVAYHEDENMWEETATESPKSPLVWSCKIGLCPNCDRPIVKLESYTISGHYVTRDFMIYPHDLPERKPVGDGVPDNLMEDYTEACRVLSISSKASAALSRRVLQAILLEQGYQERNLFRQIQAVLNESDPSKALPTNLKETIDAVRNFGNFSAHPVTETTSLQIIDVESEESEWCLEIIESLFDYYYIRPAADRKRLSALNQKLTKAGKPTI